MSDDELVRRYLLGDLPGDELEALEKRLLTEDDLFELAEAVEAEVLEDYARGELTSEQREQVARYLAASPEGRLRLAVVQGLAATPVPEGRLLPFRPVVLRAADKARALAAMLVMVVGAALLAGIYVLPLKMQKKTEDKVVQATPTPTPVPVPPPPPPPIIYVATIALSSLRDEATIPSFDISDLTDIVELRLTLPTGDEGYPSYRVVLKDAAEQEVKESQGLHVSRRTRQIALRMDADQLPSGRYTLTVQGVTPEGEVENLAFPQFEVQEP